MLDHMETLVLTFKGTSSLFSIVAVSVYNLTNRIEGVPFREFFSMSTNQMSKILILLRNKSVNFVLFYLVFFFFFFQRERCGPFCKSLY